MELMLASGLFAVAAACAALMGFAIQRGATCAVAAVEEVVHRRGVTRAVALLEASLWVATGLALARQVHWLPHAPAAHVVSPWTVVGGMLLGAGAFVNRACVFGAVARLGSGQWAYLATPLGFYLGCVSAPTLFHRPPEPAWPDVSASWALPAGLAWILAAALLAGAAWRHRVSTGQAALPHARPLAAAGRPRAWTPHGATQVIALSFLALTLVSGTWAYTDVLAELAQGMSHSLAARSALVVCLLAGAVAGGWPTARMMPRAEVPAALARCLAGGVLMGWGGQLIPGGNDGLILIGMPLLQPHAWVALGTMCLTIALAIRLQQRLQAVASAPG